MQMLVRVLLQLLDFLQLAMIALISTIIVTGGGRLETSMGRIEVSQVNAWMAVLLILFGLRTFIARGTTHPKPAPLTLALDAITAKLQNIRRPERTFWITLLSFAALFALIHCFRHWSWHTNVMDMGIVHHSLFRGWNLSPLLSCELCPNRTYLAEHTSFALILASPWIGIFESNELLFAIQSLIMAFGLAWLIRRGPLEQTPKQWMLALVIILCHPALRNTWIWDFREDHLAYLFLCAASWAAYHQRLGWLALSSALAMSCKENIAFILPGLYLAAWLRHRKDMRVYAALTLANLIWIVVTFKVLMPEILRGVRSTHEIVLRLPGLGSTPEEAVQNLVSKPTLLFQILFGHLLGKSGIHYMIGVLGPWIFIARKAWVWLIPVALAMGMNLVSGAETQRSMQFHYELAFLPFLILAVTEGLPKLSAKQVQVALVLALLFSGRWPGLPLRQNLPTALNFAQSRWIKETIPQEGTLGTTSITFAQAALRNEIRLFFVPDKRDWSSFWAAQTEDRTRVPGHTLHQAEWLLLDASKSEELALAEQVAAPWRTHAKSPDGRLILLTRLHVIRPLE